MKFSFDLVCTKSTSKMKTIRVIRTLDCGSPVGDWVGDFENPTRCKYPTIKNIYKSFGTVDRYLVFKFEKSLEILLLMASASSSFKQELVTLGFKCRRNVFSKAISHKNNANKFVIEEKNIGQEVNCISPFNVELFQA